jgi:hypothetical protein
MERTELDLALASFAGGTLILFGSLAQTVSHGSIKMPNWGCGVLV